MDYPKSVPGIGLKDGKFVDEDYATGQPGSLVPSAWGNGVTEEILNVVRKAGLEPDEADCEQLHKAISKLIDKKLESAIASEEEAQAGSDNTKTMTPLRVAEVTKKATENLQPKLDFTPVQQGTGAGQNPASVVKIGWRPETERVKVTVDQTDLGNVVFDGNLAASLDGKLDKTGGAITGDLSILGGHHLVLKSEAAPHNGHIVYTAHIRAEHYKGRTYSGFLNQDRTAWNLMLFDDGEAHLRKRPFWGAVPWDAANFDPNSKANARAQVQWDSVVEERGPIFINYQAPAPQVLVGVRGGSSGATADFIFIRSVYLRNT